MDTNNKEPLKKLTDWANEPDITKLKNDLENVKPSHDAQTAKIAGWAVLRDGGKKIKKVKGRSNVQPKLIRRQAEWRYSALSEPFLSSNKMFSVSPRTFEDDLASKQNELILNYQFDTVFNKVKFIDEFVRTTVDDGTAILRVGWNRVTKKILKKYPIFTYYSLTQEEEYASLSEAIQLKENNPRYYNDLSEEIKASVDYYEETGLPTSASITGYIEVPETEYIENHPTIELIHPDNIFIDPTCKGDIEKAGFIINSFETSKAELIKDGRYKNLDFVNFSGSTVSNETDHKTNIPSDYENEDILRKRVIAYEYWGNYDIHGNNTLVPIIATWIGSTLIRLEENPFPDKKHPFVVSNYLPVKMSVFGEPDAVLLEENQAILGATVRGMIDTMGRSANSQQGYAKNFLDVVNKRRFENGQDYEYNPGIDPRIGVYHHTYPELPNSAITMVNMQNQEAESLSGVKGFSGGVSGESYGEVAAGIKGVLDASSKREMNILRRLANTIREIGTKIASLNAVFLSEEEVVRITNEKFVTVKREELKGNFDIIVDISTPEIDEQKSQDLGFMLQTLGPDMPQDMKNMLLAEIAELKRMPSLANKIKKYEPTPDPLQEQLKQLELQKLQTEIAKLESDISLNNAKEKETLAKAENTEVDTINDLSGEKHNRDLEKQKAQARGNQSLAITNAITKPVKEGESPPDVQAAIGYNELSKVLDQ